MSCFKYLSIFCMILFISCTNSYAQAELPTEEEFFQLMETDGVLKAVELFHKIRQKNPNAVIFGELQLNALGYRYLGEENIEDALTIFKLNIEAYPEAFNTYLANPPTFFNR